MPQSCSGVGAIVVMGVSGVGKSTVGRALAARLTREFLEADDFHPIANIRKMASGIPLTEADREPWLERIARRLRRARAEGIDPVLACSALSRASRATLRRASPSLRLVFLRTRTEVLAARLRDRAGHFMPPSLLDSQLRALQEPRDAIVVDASLPVETIVARLVQDLAGS